MTPTTLAATLTIHPFPCATFELTPPCCRIAVGVTYLRYDGAWHSGGRSIPCAIPEGTVTGEIVHAEIRRVLAIVNAPAKPPPTLAEIKADGAGPELPADDPYIPTLAEIADEPPLEEALHDRLTDEMDRRRDAEQALAKMTDAHAVVSQRLVGSQKEVAEVSAERDRLKKQTAAMRVNYAEFERRGQALDEAIARTDKVEDRLRRDDELREQIAAAVGLDGSASLALILDTVTRDRPDDPRGVKDLRALVNYHQAPIKFNDRPLTLAERASFVIRRLWQGRANAAAEAAALRRELGDISDALGDLPDTAEREPIGDREEHLGLSTAERIRLSR